METVQGSLGRFQIRDLLWLLLFEVVLTDLVDDLLAEVLLEVSLTGDVLSRDMVLACELLDSTQLLHSLDFVQHLVYCLL